MYKVLIADDELFILEGLREIINWEEHGLEIGGEATNGIEALEIIKSTKIHILVTDIKMPKMDGLELIKIIRDSYPEIKVVIISGYDDFGLLKKAMKYGIENYLLKPVNTDELSSTLLNIVDKIDIEIFRQSSLREGTDILRANLLQRLVSNTISESEFIEKSVFLNLNFNYNQYIVCVLRFLSGGEQKRNSDQIANNICNELLCNNMSGTENGLSFSDLNGDIVIIFFGNELKRVEINCVIRQCIQRINAQDMDVFAAIGDLQKDFRTIHQSYEKARDLIEYHLILPPNSIIDYERIEKATCERERSVNIDHESLKQLIISKNKQAVMEFIIGIFNQIQQIKNVRPSYIQNIAVELVYHINNTVKSLIRNDNEYYESMKAEYASVFKAKTFAELVSYFQLIIGKAIDILNLEEKSYPLIKQVYYYIHKNYADDISLRMLSCKFNVNAAYLGQLFKKETGELLSNYLNRIRIEKAKELLSNTSMKANEIAEKVGYVEPNYFYRAFKKITNLSPSEFRKSFTLHN